jgi:hypothetical protein
MIQPAWDLPWERDQGQRRLGMVTSVAAPVWRVCRVWDRLCLRPGSLYRKLRSSLRCLGRDPDPCLAQRRDDYLAVCRPQCLRRELRKRPRLPRQRQRQRQRQLHRKALRGFQRRRSTTPLGGRSIKMRTAFYPLLRVNSAEAQRKPTATAEMSVLKPTPSTPTQAQVQARLMTIKAMTPRSHRPLGGPLGQDQSPLRLSSPRWRPNQDCGWGRPRRV